MGNQNKLPKDRLSKKGSDTSQNATPKADSIWDTSRFSQTKTPKRQVFAETKSQRQTLLEKTPQKGQNTTGEENTTQEPLIPE